MSSVMVMVLVLVSLFIPAVRPSEGLWKLECQPTVGIVAQTTVISCLSKGNENVKIVAISLTKSPEKKPFLQINLNQKKTSGDQRFSLKNPALDPSLQISDTMFSDEGEYLYRVITNRGEQKAQLSISITAKYNNPITSTWPEDVTNGGSVDLYCNATDGYPAGFIHWFDRSGANWTKTSHLTKANKDSNGLKSVALSSKLTFKSIDLDAVAPFRCIVLNSKYSQDGESTLRIKSAIRDHIEEPSVSNTTHIVAGVLVIGSLIVGILCALLCFRKRNVQHGRRPSAHPILSYESGRTDDDDDQETGNISN